MQVNIVPSLGEPVGKRWMEAQKSATVRDNDFLVSCPLSSTPLPIYKWIIDNAAAFPEWEKTRFVLMDEQVEGLKAPFHYVNTNDDASYENFALRHFLMPLRKITSCNIPVIKPELSSLETFEPRRSVDLLILALGIKGNYANVMPKTPRHVGWHVAKLIPEFQVAHTHQDSASYAGAKFREYGMSLGPQQVLKAKQVIVIVSGEKKRSLVSELASFDHYDPEFPLSIIHDIDVAPRVSVYLTEDIGDAWPRTPQI